MLVEFRFPLPLTLEEYRVGQLYTVAVETLENTDGDSQVDVVQDEPYTDHESHGPSGHFTFKIFHVGSKMPPLLRAVLPKSAGLLEEHAWNAFPECHTEYRNPWLGSRAGVTLVSRHVENDNGSLDNVFNLSDQQLRERTVVFVDIGGDIIAKNEMVANRHDPSRHVSNKTGRGPLVGQWHADPSSRPMMCAYKLADLRFHIFGLQTKAERALADYQRTLLLYFHKHLFCLLDEWHGMTLEEVRDFERQVKAQLLEKKRALTPSSSTSSLNSSA
jgi:hypothetical protein